MALPSYRNLSAYPFVQLSDRTILPWISVESLKQEDTLFGELEPYLLVLAGIVPAILIWSSTVDEIRVAFGHHLEILVGIEDEEVDAAFDVFCAVVRSVGIDG